MLAVVIGTIHPVSYGWRFDQPVRIPFPDGKWMVNIWHSQFHVFIDGQKPEDLETFINEVMATVQGCLDSLGFHLATSLRAEFMSMVIDGNQLALRRPGWPDLLSDPSISHATRINESELQPFVVAAIKEPLVRLALADLRLAIESPDDTCYLAYRAVESVRQWFLVGEHDDKKDAQSWKEMHAALALGDIDESSFVELKRLAGQRRHGAVASPTESQRKDALVLARDVVERFIAHINNA